MSDQPQRNLADLVFTAFNRRIVAVDRYEGTVVWDWKLPQGSGFVSLLLDGDRLIAGCNGYLYCLDPLYGQEVWRNPLKGFGHGIMSIASMRGSSAADDEAAATAAAAAAQSAANAAAVSAAAG